MFIYHWKLCLKIVKYQHYHLVEYKSPINHVPENLKTQCYCILNSPGSLTLANIFNCLPGSYFVNVIGKTYLNSFLKSDQKA